MLWTPFNSFGEYEENWGSSVTVDKGASITPGINDAKGSYTDLLGGTVSEDTWGIAIHLSKGAFAGEGRPILCDIGIDRSGGTSYSVLIPNLNAACAEFMSAVWQGGYHYFFPLFIPAGARIAARAQVGHGTARVLWVGVTLYQKPSRTELFKHGSFVDAIGLDTANSRGTDISANMGFSNAEGTWTLLGALSRDAWWLQPSLSIDHTGTPSFTNGREYYADFAIGTASAKRIIVQNLSFIQGSGNEGFSGAQTSPFQGFCRMPSGTNLYARAMISSAALDTGVIISAMGYALGG